MIDSNKLRAFNEAQLPEHQKNWDFLVLKLIQKGMDIDALIEAVGGFQIAIPSWAMGTGGTRFGRFPQGGEPANLADKIRDLSLIHI